MTLDPSAPFDFFGLAAFIQIKRRLVNASEVEGDG